MAWDRTRRKHRSVSSRTHFRRPTVGDRRPLMEKKHGNTLQIEMARLGVLPQGRDGLTPVGLWEAWSAPLWELLLRRGIRRLLGRALGGSEMPPTPEARLPEGGIRPVTEASRPSSRTFTKKAATENSFLTPMT